jgi:acyl-coenzyme A synthetase/AMP-(fatty) acid ligase
LLLRPEYGKKVMENELMEFCRLRLAGCKRPCSIDFVAELPKNTAGKIDKAGLKRYYKDFYEQQGIKPALG